MNTLHKLQATIDQLFADAEKTNGLIRERLSSMSSEERQRRMSDPNADHRGFYAMMKDVHLAVSPETGKLLYMLARSNGSKAIVEFGTSFGISTLHLAAALHDNGGGRLIGSEFEAQKVEAATKHLREAGLGALVDIRPGDALETLARDLPETIDFVLLDGAKPLYGRILDLLEPRLRVGTVLVADNADACPEYVKRVRESGHYVSVPFGEEVEVSVRV